MRKNSLTDKELSELNQDELFLYIILKTSKYLNLKKISYGMIKEIYHKNITNARIDHLFRSLINKKIIIADEFTILKEDSK